MPMIKKQFTPEQLENARQLQFAAISAGAVKRHQKCEYPIDARFEEICINKTVGTVVFTHDGFFNTPTTPEAWVESCKSRGLVAVVDNI